jgi:hypothetical protein
MNEKQSIPLATLDDLAVPKLKVIVQLGQDSEGNQIERILPLKLLSWHRVRQLRNSIPNPPAPITNVERISGRMVVQHDFAEPSYVIQMDEAEIQRTLLIIYAAWDETELPLPGSTNEQKMQWIRDNLSANIVNQIISLLSDEALKGKARIEERASQFR